VSLILLVGGLVVVFLLPARWVGWSALALVATALALALRGYYEAAALGVVASLYACEAGHWWRKARDSAAAGKYWCERWLQEWRHERSRAMEH